jgi:hypothetical protein
MMEDDDMDASLDGPMSKRAVSRVRYTEGGTPIDHPHLVRCLPDTQDPLRQRRAMFQLQGKQIVYVLLGVSCESLLIRAACKTTPPQQKAQRQRVHISEE